MPAGSAATAVSSMNSLITISVIVCPLSSDRLDRVARVVVSAAAIHGNKTRAGAAGSMARVLTLGITVFDTVLRVGDMPRHGGKFYATGRAEVVGGIAANAAIAIVRLGGEAMLASRVGDDLVGERIVGDLAAAGVDTCWSSG